MSSIDDFLAHRWEDAKVELRKLDADFVRKFEAEVRLQALGLEPPWTSDANRVPALRLSSKWHRLLESCTELAMQVTTVKTSAVCLTAEANAGLSDYEAGMRADYHFRSWFIHATALTENADVVINQTAELYIAEPVERKKVAKRHRTSVYEQIAKQIKKQRDSYVHGAVRSWVSGITEEELWEKFVAGGMTPRSFLEEIRYPMEGNNVKSGKHDWFVAATEAAIGSLGSIFQSLEADIQGRILD